MTDLLQVTALAGAAIALAGGFALGTLFGRKLVADLATMVHALDSRLGSVESAVHGAAVSAQHTAALEHHAQATEKLAAAIHSSAGATATAAK
ncbi:MAG TPA: hypothetical protein VMV27_14055 [Candidatus Binataceae bacterium]|nr:hypothetical protein [Candidatus Binataceae bacterium]